MRIELGYGVRLNSPKRSAVLESLWASTDGSQSPSYVQNVLQHTHTAGPQSSQLFKLLLVLDILNPILLITALSNQGGLVGGTSFDYFRYF